MILIWLGALVFVADRLTILLITTHMTEGESIPVLPNIFHITFVLNPGAAFGMLAHSRSLFLVVGLAALAAVWYFRKEILAEDLAVRAGAALFVGGALGNLWDRFRTGLVIDFLDFRIWPVFNVADIAICTGVALIVLSLFRREAAEQGREKNHDRT